MQGYHSSYRTVGDPLRYLPEGYRTPIGEGTRPVAEELERAYCSDRIIEVTVGLCDSDFCLHADLGAGIEGRIPKEQCLYLREGEELKDIAVLTRVGKSVACKVREIEHHPDKTIVHLSRRAAQVECEERYLSTLTPGDLIPAKVTHLEPFGAFCDVGCGIVALLSIDAISVSRISHPSDRLSPGQKITAVVKAIDPIHHRIFLSLKELLGTWEENASLFLAGQTVTGIVRSIEPYGVFVELTPNLAGLAERPTTDMGIPLPSIGESVAVYIKSILPERMKIKLVLIDPIESEAPEKKRKKALRYFITPQDTPHIDRFRYSPAASPRVVETVFGEQ